MFKYQTNSGNKNKILILGPLPPTIGGITTFIMGILNSNLNQKYSFKAYGTERPTFGISKSGGGYSLIFNIGLSNFIKCMIHTMWHIIKFPYVLLKFRPDIVHIHTPSYWVYWENAVYIIISKIFKRKVLTHIHGASFDKFVECSNRIEKTLIKKTLELSDGIIVLSNRWENFFNKYIKREKIIVLENYVDASQFLDKSKIDPDFIKKVIFIGGVSSKRKGLYDILKAIPIVLKSYEKVKFIIMVIGNSDEVSEICKDKNINFYVEVHESISEEEKNKIFSTSDIFLLPSYSEGLPISILEAMAAGLPVITTRVGGIPEVIEEGENGFFVEPGDFQALADMMLLLLKDDILRDRIMNNNLKKIKENYDLAVITSRLDKIYDMILE